MLMARHPDALQREAQRQGVRQGRLFAAVQSKSNNMRLFDILNELEIYVDKYASSRIVSSKADTAWSTFASFKWIDAAYNVGGMREKAVNLGLEYNPLTADAYQKLKGNAAAREALKQALRDGDFVKACEVAKSLDEDGARKALAMAKLDKLAEDKADFLDFEGMLGRNIPTICRPRPWALRSGVSTPCPR